MLIPLRNYSNYSICESNIKIDDLVNFADKEKLPAMALTDYKLLTNCGRGAGQEIFHLHFHLMGGGPC